MQFSSLGSSTSLRDRRYPPPETSVKRLRFVPFKIESNINSSESLDSPCDVYRIRAMVPSSSRFDPNNARRRLPSPAATVAPSHSSPKTTPSTGRSCSSTGKDPLAGAKAIAQDSGSGRKVRGDYVVHADRADPPVERQTRGRAHRRHYRPRNSGDRGRVSRSTTHLAGNRPPCSSIRCKSTAARPWRRHGVGPLFSMSWASRTMARSDLLGRRAAYRSAQPRPRDPFNSTMQNGFLWHVRKLRAQDSSTEASRRWTLFLGHVHCGLQTEEQPAQPVGARAGLCG